MRERSDTDDVHIHGGQRGDALQGDSAGYFNEDGTVDDFHGFGD